MRNNNLPAELGDLGCRHAVNVFVFRQCALGPEYLLLRNRKQADGLWRPVVRPISHREGFRLAAMDAVREQVGLRKAFDFFLPASGVVDYIGDLQLVEWPIAFRPQKEAPRLSDGLCAKWWNFDTAMKQLGLSAHRQNLLQLHWKICA